MITKPILTSFLASLMFCSGCAAKNSWFSRKDYSEMQDPFMQDRAVASSAAGSDRPEDNAGRARLDGLTADANSASLRPGATRLAGPKPIPPKESTRESTARTRSVANASYPQDDTASKNRAEGNEPAGKASAVRSYQGSALSDFLSRKSAESARPAEAPSGEAIPPKVAQAAATSAPSAAISKPATTLSSEAADFRSFLQQNSNPPTRAAQQVAQTKEITEDSVNDFAAWAEQQKADWSKGSGEVASNAKTQTEDSVHSAAQQAEQIADKAAHSLSGDDEVAEALIRRPAQPFPRSESAVAGEISEKAAPAVDENPFDNPFDFAETAPIAAQPRTSTPPAVSSQPAATRRRLDDSFQMDNGWKPAHMTRP